MSDKFEELKKKYTGSFGQKQKDIKSAWDENNFKELESLLHKLAGSSGSYEFLKLSQLCRQAMKFINYNIEIDEKKQFESCLDAMFIEMDKYVKS